MHRSDKFWVRGGEGRGLSSILEPLKTIKMCELSSALVGVHLPSLSLAAEGERYEAAREQERAPQVSGRGAVGRVLCVGAVGQAFSAVHCECPCVQPLPRPSPQVVGVSDGGVAELGCHCGGLPRCGGVHPAQPPGEEVSLGFPIRGVPKVEQIVEVPQGIPLGLVAAVASMVAQWLPSPPPPPPQGAGGLWRQSAGDAAGGAQGLGGPHPGPAGPAEGHGPELVRPHAGLHIGGVALLVRHISTKPTSAHSALTLCSSHLIPPHPTLPTLFTLSTLSTPVGSTSESSC